MASGFLDRIVKNYFASFRAFAGYGVYKWPMSGVPVSGTSGTGVGVLDFGSKILNTLTGVIYMNIGTISSPTWVPISGGLNGYAAAVVLTSAQVKAFRATPITVIAALGAGFVAEVQEIGVYLLYGGSNAFTNVQDMKLRYKDGAGVVCSPTITAAGLLDQTASTGTNGISPAAATVTKAQADNQPIVIHNEGGSEVTGNAANNNTLLVTATYRVTQPGW